MNSTARLRIENLDSSYLNLSRLVVDCGTTLASFNGSVDFTRVAIVSSVNGLVNELLGVGDVLLDGVVVRRGPPVLDGISLPLCPFSAVNKRRGKNSANEHDRLFFHFVISVPFA